MNPSGTNTSAKGDADRSLPQVGLRWLVFVPAAFTAVVLAGCSGAHAVGDRTASVQDITLDTTDGFRFAPATVTVHPGRVRITLTDTGTYPHNISFPGLHATSASVSGSPGQTSTTLLLTITTPGRYDFVCTYHSSAGMKGVLVVLKQP